VCIITFNALFGDGPEYVKGMLEVRALNYGLRSNDVLTLKVPVTTCKTLGDRAFKVAAPNLWNALSVDLRCIRDLNIFKRKLKTFYFNEAYGQ